MPETTDFPLTADQPGGAEVGELQAGASSTATSGRTRLLKNVATACIFAIVVGALVWFFARPSTDSATSRPVSLKAAASGPGPQIGKPAPDFSISTLDGSPVALSDYRGQPVWLTFWASWCPPCRAEAPDIEAASQQYKAQGLIVLAVNLGESPATARDFVQRLGLTFTIAGDPATDVGALYRVSGLPSHFFIDSDGVLRDSRLGALGQKTIQQELRPIIMRQGATPANR